MTVLGRYAEREAALEPLRHPSHRWSEDGDNGMPDPHSSGERCLDCGVGYCMFCSTSKALDVPEASQRCPARDGRVSDAVQEGIARLLGSDEWSGEWRSLSPEQVVRRVLGRA